MITNSKIIESFYKDIQDIAGAVTRSHELRYDLASEVCVYLLELKNDRLNELAQDPDNFRRYIFSTVYRTWTSSYAPEGYINKNSFRHKYRDSGSLVVVEKDHLTNIAEDVYQDYNPLDGIYNTMERNLLLELIDCNGSYKMLADRLGVNNKVIKKRVKLIYEKWLK